MTSEGWDIKILGNVIEINSYVAFFRMEPLAALLLREFCSQQKISRHANQQEQHVARETAQKPQCLLPLAISLIVSSSNWHLSPSKDKAPSTACVSEMAWHLQRMACLPAKTLETNEYSFSQLEFVKSEPLYDLKAKSAISQGDSRIVLEPSWTGVVSDIKPSWTGFVSDITSQGAGGFDAGGGAQNECDGRVRHPCLESGGFGGFEAGVGLKKIVRRDWRGVGGEEEEERNVDGGANRKRQRLRPVADSDDSDDEQEGHALEEQDDEWGEGGWEGEGEVAVPEHASERSRQAIEEARSILSQSKLKGMKSGGRCGGDADAKCDDATNVKCDDATRTCPAPAPAFPSQKEQGTAQGEVEEGEQHQSAQGEVASNINFSAALSMLRKSDARLDCPHLPPYVDVRVVVPVDFLNRNEDSYPDGVNNYNIIGRCQGTKKDGTPCDYKCMLQNAYLPLTRFALANGEIFKFKSWTNPVACRNQNDVVRAAQGQVEGQRGWHKFWFAVHHLEAHISGQQQVSQDQLELWKSWIRAKAKHFNTNMNDFQVAGLLGGPPFLNGEVILVESTVSAFRDDMKKFMEDFLHQRRLCELLLVAFMRDMVAPSCDAEVAENLETWQEKCDDPDANLVISFNKIMLSLKPPILKEQLSYELPDGNKKNHTSVFVIDWMVQHSPWALIKAKKDEWIEEVVRDFDPNNADSAEDFLERAEKFLQKGVKGEKWGIRILRKVIETS